MAVTGINKSDKKVKPSKLDTASRLLGALSSAGSIAGQIQGFTETKDITNKDLLKNFQKSDPRKGATKVKVKG